ncbi:putative molybdopterin binding domain protein [Pseudooceanicola marinus]|uniref:Putative molybdopterin binding domain protein n=1 Tax=Pseudooceanicola marinus TaxID=396013 RepID=A0A1X6ZE29_9RHOB|nr:molybdopterin-binding protein [Pseudooceanicola marinus]PJE28348.1 molybdopterin biosynthesis protein [Pseudooceanicola marinus]SLN48308.1 putative molybdopterin binding domain protein [Pseudooceanicola marinus]
MKFGPVAVSAAEGAILAHSLDLPDGSRLRKGLRLGKVEMERLDWYGVEEVVAARLEAGDVHEDAAADALARALVPELDGLRLGVPGTGRVNVFAETTGVAEIDAKKINAVNALHPMITVATVPPWQRMAVRGMVATVKVISYAVPGAALEAACAAGQGALRLRPVTRRRATLIQTFVGEELQGKGPEAVAKRLHRLGADLVAESNVPHEEEALSLALAAAREAAQSDVILILTGSATSDPDDVAPAALRHAGGHMERFGMPVDPGNLLFFGDLAGLPVIGLPGCARSPALNGADWVLERILCDVPVTDADVAAMGVGGLLKEIPTRPQPRDPK